jgi:glycerophosphoryl diester phosphodiesterase
VHHGPSLPENSLAAFAGALEVGAGIECDLRLTADDQIMVFHDSDAWRLCASPLRIADSTAADLRRLSIGEHPIPPLERLLQFVDGRVPLLLEIKVQDDIWRWSPALKRDLAGYPGAFGIMSFDPRISRLMKIYLPKVRRGLVVGADLPSWRRHLAVPLGDPQFIAVDRAALGERWVKRLRRKMPVYSWTIRTAEQRAQARVHADALIWEADGGPRI